MRQRVMKHISKYDLDSDQQPATLHDDLGDWRPARSVAEAVAMGGAPPIDAADQFDPRALLQAFPRELAAACPASKAGCDNDLLKEATELVGAARGCGGNSTACTGSELAYS